MTSAAHAGGIDIEAINNNPAREEKGRRNVMVISIMESVPGNQVQHLMLSRTVDK